jgi:hypothetical protein
MPCKSNPERCRCNRCVMVFFRGPIHQSREKICVEQNNLVPKASGPLQISHRRNPEVIPF